MASNQMNGYGPPAPPPPRVVPAVAVANGRHVTWGTAVQEYQIALHYPNEQAQVRVGVRDESGFVRGAIIRIYGLPNGEVGVAIESDEGVGEHIADLMNQQILPPPVLRRQVGQYMYN